MVVVRGVNVFPSQVEQALLGIEGLEPHYQIILSTRPDYQTDLRVRVEMSENVVADPATLAALRNQAMTTLRDALGLKVTVDLTPPFAIPRSEGKAVCILDQRKAE